LESIGKLLQGDATCAQKPDQDVVAPAFELFVLTRREELAVCTQEPLELLFIIHSHLTAQKRTDPGLESREVAQSLTILVSSITPYYAALQDTFQIRGIPPLTLALLRLYIKVILQLEGSDFTMKIVKLAKKASSTCKCSKSC
jgi:hypothetical protein